MRPIQSEPMSSLLLNEVLNKSMDFIFINSGILEANTPEVSSKIEQSLTPYQDKIQLLLTSISKSLPSAVCTRNTQVRNLLSNKKCAKGFSKTELSKPF